MIDNLLYMPRTYQNTIADPGMTNLPVGVLPDYNQMAESLLGDAISEDSPTERSLYDAEGNGGEANFTLPPTIDQLADSSKSATINDLLGISDNGGSDGIDMETYLSSL